MNINYFVDHCKYSVFVFYFFASVLAAAKSEMKALLFLVAILDNRIYVKTFAKIQFLV